MLEQEAGSDVTESNIYGDHPYPAPAQWYLATSKSFLRSYTDDEFNAIGTEGYVTAADAIGD